MEVQRRGTQAWSGMHRNPDQAAMAAMGAEKEVIGFRGNEGSKRAQKGQQKGCKKDIISKMVIKIECNQTLCSLFQNVKRLQKDLKRSTKRPLRDLSQQRTRDPKNHFNLYIMTSVVH